MDAALKQYKKIDVNQGIDDASPHRLILMLLDGALGRLAAAKGFIEHNEVARKGETIGSAISIIDGLRVSLDMDQGGEIAENLESLYDYMQRRLLEANLNSDAAIVDEVVSLLGEIREAWIAIEPVAREMGKG